MPITIFNDFDAYGNLYFIGSVSYKIFKSSDSYLDYEDIQDLVIIYKFNPVDSSLEYKQLPQHSTGFDFCISKTGSWAFIAVLEDYTYMAGSPEIYTLSMDNETPPQKLLCTEYYYSSLDNCVRGFCYDKNTNTFYYSLENLYDMQTSGLYKLTADFKGNFPIENLVFDDSFFPCKLYSNKEGLWGLIENAKDADTSSLVLLKDPDGNSIKNRSEDADIHIPGNKKYNRNVLVEDDFILFINKTKSKVLKFSNGKISDVSKYRPHRKSYTQEDLITINNLILEDNLSKKNSFNACTVLYFWSHYYRGVNVDYYFPSAMDFAS